MRLRSASHLYGVFETKESEKRVRVAVKKLKRKKPDVLVVTGISGTVLGARVAAKLGCHLAVVRRPAEAQSTLSGSANDVEGYLGGRWVFFDDCIATGTTHRRARKAYIDACNVADEPTEYLGLYLHHGYGEWYGADASYHKLSDHL